MPPKKYFRTARQTTPRSSLRSSEGMIDTFLTAKQSTSAFRRSLPLARHTRCNRARGKLPNSCVALCHRKRSHTRHPAAARQRHVKSTEELCGSRNRESPRRHHHQRETKRQRKPYFLRHSKLATRKNTHVTLLPYYNDSDSCVFLRSTPLTPSVAKQQQDPTGAIASDDKQQFQVRENAFSL